MTDQDVEALADLFMDLRLDGPAADGWTYQQTARHYARIILAATPAPTGLDDVRRYITVHLQEHHREGDGCWDKAAAALGIEP